MSERPRNRKPATFKLDDPSVVVTDPNEEGRPARGHWTHPLPRDPPVRSARIPRLRISG